MTPLGECVPQQLVCAFVRRQRDCHHDCDDNQRDQLVGQSGQLLFDLGQRNSDGFHAVNAAVKLKDGAGQPATNGGRTPQSCGN